MNKNEIDDAAIALRKEKDRVASAKYRASNSEKIKAYNIANAAKIKIRNAEYYAAHADEIKEKVKAYRVTNAQKINEYQIKYYAAKKQERAAAKPTEM